MARLSDKERSLWEWMARAEAAERERDEAREEARRYDTALAVLEASTTKIGDGEWVEEYRWKTGAYHKILGFRPKIIALAAEFEIAKRERDEALAANEAAKQFSYASHRRRAEDAEALAERRLADLRTYWTHCGYPEWYGDEERAWLRAALADGGQA